MRDIVQRPGLSVFMAVSTLVTGCFADEGPHSDSDSAGTGIIVVYGHRWCAEAEGAEAYYHDPTEGGVQEVPLEDEENEGDGPPEGCECADDMIDTALNAIGQGSVVVNGTHSQDLQDFRDLVFAATEERCEELAGALMPAPDSNNCSSLLVAGTTPIAPSAGTCALSIAGVPVDGWDDYYTLTSVISRNTTTGVYEIDMAFFEDVVANPRWLFADEASIGFNGTSYQFYGCTSGDIAYALGIRTGHRPLTLNGMDVTDIEEVYAAMTALRYETEYQFVVLGGAGPVTLNYEIIP
ncbi:hypothetical protein [Nannocystis sp. SCPEA4]|uniref:hypothetical protein n=1 Tax=Nannocystis sp. SCPEA4 TaxID=2996787 RepID=UPI00226EFB72|nr:hypothetical protein [Nannocystis sp. SCPEA4]MCY1053988.1 hypothetical protein [Nannocystis sp. SCPEA4]